MEETLITEKVSEMTISLLELSVAILAVHFQDSFQTSTATSKVPQTRLQLYFTVTSFLCFNTVSCIVNMVWERCKGNGEFQICMN
jgi:hypothetical protein